MGIAVAGSLLPRLVKTFFPPERVGLVTGLYMFAMMGAAALASAASAPLADRLGSWQASLASWALLALIGLLVWAPFTLRANPHHTPARRAVAAAVAASHGVARRRVPRPAVLVLLLRGDVAAADLRRARLGRSAAGYLGAAFSGAQVISGLLGPILSDRATDLRRLLLFPRPGWASSAASPSSRPRGGSLGVGRGAGSGPGARRSPWPSSSSSATR